MNIPEAVYQPFREGVRGSSPQILTALACVRISGQRSASNGVNTVQEADCVAVSDSEGDVLARNQHESVALRLVFKAHAESAFRLRWVADEWGTNVGQDGLGLRGR